MTITFFRKHILKQLYFLIFTFLFFNFSLLAQPEHVFPTNWFTGMQWNKVQVLFKADYEEFGKSDVAVKYAGVTLNKVHRFANGKYIAADITIAPSTKPGNVIFSFGYKGKAHAILWPLKAKRNGNGTAYAQGVTNKDFIYFLMPDRFSNGEESNDKVMGMLDQTLNRDSIYHRHGGDLNGVINHIDYFKSMGASAIWLTPVIENDMPNRTEHGYAFTNHYKIDPRIGGNEGYKKLADALHKNGLKLIQDAVYNHVGVQHILYKEMPDSNWFHQWPTFTQTSYKDQTLYDPYASKKDYKKTADGWFVREMPDWNHDNKFVENFLIQHALWSVEEFAVDGWRIDTYLYNDLPFMNRCNAALYKEYPKITLFGETWVHGVVSQSYFAENNMNAKFKSNLQGVTDFQTLFYGITPALNEKFGWTEGVNKLYTTLAQDILYKDASRNVVFLDNHDISRFFSVIGEDVAKQNIALKWMFTVRGIPQLYYGTEILMKGFTNPDGWVRLDFAGGWRGDKKNAFTGEGLTKDEKATQDLVKKMGLYRKQTPALQNGAFMQFVPQDGLYVYFRYDASKTIMCVMNTTDKEMNVAFNDYLERTNGFTKAFEVTTNMQVANTFKIAAKTMYVLELQK
jgi:neopullulanase